MQLSAQIAQQFREVQLHGNWVATNLKTQLSDVTRNEATAKIGTLNTIAALTFHIHYYVAGLITVLEGGPLTIRDKYSFDLPALNSEADWQELLQRTWNDAEKFAKLVEQLPVEKLAADFVDEKYGNYFRNIMGMIEHSYYHLGQIVLIKKLLREGTEIGF